MLSSHPSIELTRTHRLRVDRTFDNAYFGGKDEIFIGENVVGSAFSHSFIHLSKTGKKVDEIIVWNDYPHIKLELKQEGGSLHSGDTFKIENQGEDWGFLNIDNIIRLPQKDEDYLGETHDSITEIVSRLLPGEEKLRDDIISASAAFHEEAKKILLDI